MKMTQAEIKELIKHAIWQQTDVYESVKDCKGDRQVEIMAARTKANKDTLSDVLAALEGNPVFLKMLANRYKEYAS